jgi:hypothetical protein
VEEREKIRVSLKSRDIAWIGGRNRIMRRDGKAEAAWTQGKGREKIRVSSLP